MDLKDSKATPSKRTSGNDLYDDHNIPDEDLPQDMIPDEVPRKDGPGGAPSDCHRPRS